MLTDPTTVVRPAPADAAPAPSSRRQRRRRRLIGAVASVLVVAGMALVLPARGERPADEPHRAPRVAGDPVPRPRASSSTSTSTSTSLDGAVPAAVGAVEPSESGEAAAGPTAPSIGPLTLTPASGLDFLVGVDEMAMTLRNDGGRAADWAIELSNPEITVSPAEGTVAPGETVELSVVVDRTDLSNGVTYTELDVLSDAPLTHGDKVWPVFVRVEKAQVTEVVVGPQVICALQSPGPGPKAATIRATGIHMQKATSVWATVDTPAGEVFEALGYDMAGDRWITTYSSTTIGPHVVSAHAVGIQAIREDVGAVPVQVIWCP